MSVKKQHVCVCSIENWLPFEEDRLFSHKIKCVRVAIKMK